MHYPRKKKKSSAKVEGNILAPTGFPKKIRKNEELIFPLLSNGTGRKQAKSQQGPHNPNRFDYKFLR